MTHHAEKQTPKSPFGLPKEKKRKNIWLLKIRPLINPGGQSRLCVLPGTQQTWKALVCKHLTWKWELGRSLPDKRASAGPQVSLHLIPFFSGSLGFCSHHSVKGATPSCQGQGVPGPAWACHGSAMTDSLPPLVCPYSPAPHSLSPAPPVL